MLNGFFFGTISATLISFLRRNFNTRIRRIMIRSRLRLLNIRIRRAVCANTTPFLIIHDIVTTHNSVSIHSRRLRPATTKMFVLFPAIRLRGLHYATRNSNRKRNTRNRITRIRRRHTIFPPEGIRFNKTATFRRHLIRATRYDAN